MTTLGPDAAAALRAVAEAFVPGAPGDPTAGAPEIHAERFLGHYLDLLLPGLSDAVPQMLDGLASSEREGARFAELDLDERTRLLDALAVHEVAEMRQLGALLGALSLAALYGEWSGQDEHGALVRRPVGWDLTGYPGPSPGDSPLLGEPL